jgi:hypothetical protein
MVLFWHSIIYKLKCLDFCFTGEPAMAQPQEESSAGPHLPAKGRFVEAVAIANALGVLMALFTPVCPAAAPAVEITAFDAPQGLRQDQTAAFNVTVRNGGDGPAVNITVTIMDGYGTLASGAPFDLGAGQSLRISLNVPIGGPAGVDHTYTAEAGGANRSATRFVDRAMLPASIVMDAADVSPPERRDMPKDSAAVFQIAVTLRNEGELRGTVELRITGMAGAFANDTIGLDGGSSETRNYTWKVRGDRRHTAMVALTGDVGSPSNMPVSAELRYASSTPGAGPVAMIGALLLALAVAGTRSRATPRRPVEG